MTIVLYCWGFFFLLEIFLHCLYSHFYCVLHFKWDFHFLVSQYIVKLFNIHRLHNVPKVTLFQLCLQVLTQLKQQRIYTLIKYCLLFFDFKRSLFFLITNDLTLYTCLLMRPKLFRVHFLIFTFPRSLDLRKKSTFKLSQTRTKSNPA